MSNKYIDYKRGNDSNDGLTPATAWQNLSKLASFTAASGDTIYLADDSRWDVTAHVNIPSGWTGTEQNPITITKYHPEGSNGDMPTISRKRAILSSEWTYDATNNAWYAQWFPTVDVEWGCYITMGGEYGLRQEAAFPITTARRAWKNAQDNVPVEAGVDGAGRIYVYAPSTINPTDYYGSVYFAPHSRGTFSFSATGTYVIVRDIRSVDGGGLVTWYSNSADRTLIVDNCIFENTSVAVYQTSETAGTSNVIVRNCTFTGGIASYITSYGSIGIGDFIVENNTFKDGNAGYPQGNVYMQGRANKNIVRFNHFNGARHGTRFHTQDGCAIYAEVGSDNVEVYGNYIRDCYLAMQDNSGRTTKWYSNIMVDCHQQIKVTDDSAVGATNHFFWNNTMIGVGKPMVQYGGVESGGIGWYCFDNFAISLKNNLFVIHEDAVAQPAIETGLASTGVIQNTLAYGFTAVAQTYQGGACPITPSNSITTDPYMQGHTPRYDSPCINAGIAITPYIEDFYGKLIVDTTPDIGALQSNSLTQSTTVVYIDPTVGGTGTGTISDPFKSWASVTWTAGNTYLQKRGTKFVNPVGTGTNTVVVGASGTLTNPITIGAYGYGPRPIIDANGGITCINTGQRSFVIVENMELVGVNNSGGSGSGILNQNGGGTNIIVRNCEVHNIRGTSSVGVKLFGDNNEVIDCEIYDMGNDGIFAEGKNFKAWYNRIYDVSVTETGGDCIQMAETAEATGNFSVMYNYLDHRNVDTKQCFIVTADAGGAGGVFAYNTCLGFKGATSHKTVYTSMGDVRIFGNYITDGTDSVWCEASGVVVTGNLIVSETDNNAVVCNSAGVKVYNNTMIQKGTSTLAGIDHATSTHINCEFANNIIYGYTYGIRYHPTASPIERYNSIYNYTIAVVDNGNNSRSTGTGTIVTDPLFVDVEKDYRLQVDSPCNNTGIYIYGARDITGKQIKTVPDMGCYQDNDIII